MNEGGRLIYNLSEVCKAFNKAACLVTTDYLLLLLELVNNVFLSNGSNEKI